MYIVQVPKWYQEAIEGHGSVEVNISRVILTGGSRVGKTSLKYYLLHNTAREDKLSTGVLEAPEVATIAQDIATIAQDIATIAEEGDTVGQGKVEGTVGSLWKVMDNEEMGQLIAWADSKAKESFPIIATSKQEAPDQTMTQQLEGIFGRTRKGVSTLFQRRPANEATEQSLANPPQHLSLIHI